MVSPFGYAGNTRRGAKSDCLLTLLVNSTAERVRHSYRLNEADTEDVRQTILVHVLQNWKHFKPHKCTPDAALRTMVGQGCSRAVAYIKKRDRLGIMLACDTASPQGLDLVSISASEHTDEEWAPVIATEEPEDTEKEKTTITPHKQLCLFEAEESETPCSTLKTATA